MRDLIKLGLGLVLTLAGILVWVLPRTRWAGKIRMTEKTFIITQMLGILCGISGLIAASLWPDLIIEAHLMWAILLPYALIWFYYLMVMIIRKTTRIFDEKQDFNLASAGGITMALTICAMSILFQLNQAGLVRSANWYPYFFFVSIALYSGSTLILFKKN